MSNEAQIQLFIDVVNEETREKIIQLDKKLRMLRGEVENKLAAMVLYRGENPEGYKEGLLNMQHELKAALDSISTLVNLAVIPGQEAHPIFSGDAIEEFTEMLSSNIETFSKRL
jgi:hypothetical protein